MLGGRDSESTLSIVARLAVDTGQWDQEPFGQLLSGYGHGAIVVNDHILIAGGWGDKYKTEKCYIDADGLACIDQRPELTNYGFYAELVQVEDDFCD